MRRCELPAEYVVWLVIGRGRLRDRSIREAVRHLDLVRPTSGGRRETVSGSARPALPQGAPAPRSRRCRRAPPSRRRLRVDRGATVVRIRSGSAPATRCSPWGAQSANKAEYLHVGKGAP
ncbi:MAG: hypothetical protein E6J76_02445, partial [Deltaproteobacteria bacterium]